MTRKRFIAGAKCPQCHAQDTVVLLMNDLEQIECVACGYHDQRPTAEQIATLHQATVSDLTHDDGVGIVQFKPSKS